MGWRNIEKTKQMLHRGTWSIAHNTSFKASDDRQRTPFTSTIFIIFLWVAARSVLLLSPEPPPSSGLIVFFRNITTAQFFCVHPYFELCTYGIYIKSKKRVPCIKSRHPSTVAENSDKVIFLGYVPARARREPSEYRIGNKTNENHDSRRIQVSVYILARSIICIKIAPRKQHRLLLYFEV